jgi:hypothetical protein
MKRLTWFISMALLAAAAGTASADFQVSGTFLYEDLPIDINGFQSPHPSRPVRLADVRVIDNVNQAVLASGATDANGSFSFLVPDTFVRNVAILALTKSDNVPNLNHYVTEWNSTAIHAYQGILVASHDPNTDIAMGTVTMHYRAGAEAFNLYDAVLDGADFIGSLEGGTRPVAVRIRYTLDVSPDVAYYGSGVVNIGGNFGYDDTIALHEFGHFVQGAYGGFTDNPAGSHYVDDSAQDPRLSWGEGWPTFWGSSARRWAGYNHPQVYLNSTGDSTTGIISFSYDLETYTASKGASSENAVQACLWDQVDDDATLDNSPGVDDEPGYQMARPFSDSWNFTRTYLAQPPFTGNETYEDYHDLWIANMPVPQTAELLQIERLKHGIFYSADDYEDDGSFATAGAYHSFEDIALGRKTLHSTWPENDEDWLKFEGLAGITYQVETTSMRDGADTYLEVRDASNTVVAFNDNVGSPSPGSFGTFELLRSKTTYTPATTQDLYVRVRRSTTAPWGPISKYGNWQLGVKATTVPSTYPNILTNPISGYTVTLGPHQQSNQNLTIQNTGSQDPLIWNIVEAGGDIPWISESLTSGSVPAGGNQITVLTFDTSGMLLGSYSGTLEIHSNDPNGAFRQFQLTLIVSVAPASAEDLTPGAATRLEPNTPNPFTSGTSIRYALGAPSMVTLVVYDLQGREIRRLVDGLGTAREHTVVWDGRDDAGRVVPSGVYLYRMTTTDGIISRKMVLTR